MGIEFVNIVILEKNQKYASDWVKQEKQKDKQKHLK